jgi:arylsulfatase A-like enzyme
MRRAAKLTSPLFLGALWWGLLAAVGEGLLQHRAHSWIWQDLLRAAIISYVLMFLAGAVVLALLNRSLEVNRSQWARATFLFATLALFDWISLAFGWKNSALSLAVAIASAAVLAAIFSACQTPALRLVRWTLPVLVLTGAWCVAAFPIKQARHERRELARLPAPRPHAPNVLVVLIDTLRADHLSAYGYPIKTSPFLDEFARRGTLFEYAFAQGAVTVASYASWLTSLYASATRVFFLTDRLQEGFLTLPEVLRSQGFETANLIQNIDAGMFAGLDQGFDRVTYLTDAQALLDEAARLLAAPARNRFVNVHLMDPHGPYDPPPDYRGWYDEAAKRTGDRAEPRQSWLDPPWLKRPTIAARTALYDGEIRHNDDLLREFLGGLEKAGILKDTLVVLTADHGEALGEDGQWLHGPPAFLHVSRVPLIMVYPPAVPAGKRVAANVQHIDLFPTVLELAGLPARGLLLQGRSLTPLFKDGGSEWDARPCYADFRWEQHRSEERHPHASLYLGRLHFMRTLDRARKNPYNFRLFDFRADPAERRDLLTDVPAHRAAEVWMADFMTAFDAADQATWEAVTRRGREEDTLSPERLERLRELGYLR